jgi:flagellar biosynthesis/type III secretory pathway protein FliH
MLTEYIKNLNKEGVEKMVANNAFMIEEMKEKVKKEGKKEGLKEGLKETIIDNLKELGNVPQNLIECINKQ